MKKRGLFTTIRQGGVLRWSTVSLLAMGAAGLTSCERSYTATEKDSQMAALQQRLDAIEAQKSRLSNGEVENNFELPGVGFYHAEARDFFPYAYGHGKDGKWYANGQWQDAPVAEAHVASSRPTPEALRKVELALEREQQLLAQQPQGGTSTTTHHSSGFGMGNALMMYWLLSGNRGFFNPGNGFQQAASQAGNWQQRVDADRGTVTKYAAGNSGYRRMVAQSKASGTPVKPGQSVRGGFGSSSRPSGSSSSRPSSGS